MAVGEQWAWVPPWSALPDEAAAGLAAVAAVLAAATALRLLWLAGNVSDTARQRRRSLITWWGLLLVGGGALVLGRWGVAAAVALVSVLVLREYLRLVPVTPPPSARWTLFAAAPLQGVWAAMGWPGAFFLFVPVGVLALLAGQCVVAQRTQGFGLVVGALGLGAMIGVYWLSFITWLMVLPEGGAGGVLLLGLLTEGNDIAQALWGRALGRRPILPRVSPHKTWEGLVAGLLTTTVLGGLLGGLLLPWLAGDQGRLAAWTFMPGQWGALAGLLIGISGFFGDVTISALKRSAGVKDSGTLLPGQGGVLDRFDSLILTAPLFTLYVMGLAGGAW